MEKKIAVDGKKVFRIKAKWEVACQVGVAHRGDYEALLRKGAVLAVDIGEGVFHLVDPVGMLHSLRKRCVKVLGRAPSDVRVCFNKKGFMRV